MALPVAAALVALITSGCGGGAGGASPSVAVARAVTVSVAWPTTRTLSTGTRALPESANSIVITVTDVGGFSDSRTVTRPAVGSTQASTSVSFFGLRAGAIQIHAVAFTGTDGTGEVVDTADANATVGVGDSGSAAIVFGDVPFSAIQITPAAPQTILQGQTYTLTAAGFDGSGNVISTSPAGQWSSSNPAIATIGAATGVVTGLLPGTATLVFTDAKYGKTSSTSVTVQGGNSTVNIQ